MARPQDSEIVKLFMTNSDNRKLFLKAYDAAKSFKQQQSKVLNISPVKVLASTWCFARRIRGCVPGWNQLTLACMGRVSRAASHTGWVATWALPRGTLKQTQWSQWGDISDYLDMIPTETWWCYQLKLWALETHFCWEQGKVIIFENFKQKKGWGCKILNMVSI